MKKLYFLLLLGPFLTLSACSSDDDGPSYENDPVLGTWTITEMYAYSQEVDMESCPEVSFITFNANGTATGTAYLESNGCAPQNSTGEWGNLGNNNYSILVPYLGSMQGRVEFEGDSRFTFFGPNGERLVFEK